MMVRRFEVDDTEDVLKLMARCYGEVPFVMPALNLAKCGMRLAACVADGFAVVAEHAGKLIGCFLGQRGTLWMSCDPLAMEVFTYVVPEARNTGAGSALYRAFRVWAKTNELPLLLANSCGYDERFEKLFTRMGLTKIGCQFLEATR